MCNSSRFTREHTVVMDFYEVFKFNYIYFFFICVEGALPQHVFVGHWFSPSAEWVIMIVS